MYNEEDFEGEEDQIINEEYKLWKYNSRYLYDTLLIGALEWPSLTIDWLPILDMSNKSYFSVQKMIIGTITNGNEPDYLMIAKARLPININLLSDTKDNPYINKDAIITMLPRRVIVINKTFVSILKGISLDT